jgi:PhoP regulatory network protein YrbL
MTQKTILLSHLTPIASGNNRDVFAHPTDAELLIKTLRPDALEKRVSPGVPWKKYLFRRYRQYQTFLRECQEHIVSHLDANGLPDFVHTIIGFVETDRGLGLVSKAERDRSGVYARTLYQIIEEGLFDNEAQTALEKFKQTFLISSVIVTDLGLRNLVYSYTQEKGSYFVVIDGYGEKNIIPLNSMFRWCHMRSKRKRLIRLARGVQRTLDLRKKAR